MEEAVADKYNYMRIDGSTPAKTRQANVENFQKDDTIRIAILSLMAAGTGVTLTRVSECVFVADIEEEAESGQIVPYLRKDWWKVADLDNFLKYKNNELKERRTLNENSIVLMTIIVSPMTS